MLWKLRKSDEKIVEVTVESYSTCWSLLNEVVSMSWSSCSTLPCQSVFQTRRNFCWTIVSRNGSGRFRAVVIDDDDAVDECTGTRIGNWKLEESEWNRVHERQFTYCLARRKSTENVCRWNSWSVNVLRCRVRSNRRRINVWDKFETISRSPWQQTVAVKKDIIDD